MRMKIFEERGASEVEADRGEMRMRTEEDEVG
jgi:hypothetical protein